jgi:hypothetical protein
MYFLYILYEIWLSYTPITGVLNPKLCMLRQLRDASQYF